MIRTPARLVAGVALVALLAVGCGDTDPGSAAVVGKDSISTDRLTSMVDRALEDPQAEAQFGADRAAFTRQELTRLISEKIIERAAADAGVSVTEGQVDERLDQYAQQAGGKKALEQQAAQGGVPVQDLRPFVRMLVLNDLLGDKLVADVPVDDKQLQAAYQAQIDQFDQVHAAHILVKDKATADQILAQVKAKPSSFAELAAKNSIDTSNKDNGGDLQFAGRGQFVKEFSDAIFEAKPGSFVEVKTQFGWHVVRIIERRTTSLAEATPQLKRDLVKEERDKRLTAALQKAAKDLGVKVNPRFGTWDRDKLNVAAPKTDASSPSPSPKPTGGGGGLVPARPPAN